MAQTLKDMDPRLAVNLFKAHGIRITAEEIVQLSKALDQ